MKGILRNLLLWMVILFTLTAISGCSSKKSGQDSASDFIKGADISSLQAIEDYGGKYYDFTGKEKSALKILKENGVNYLRLRIWNEPTLSFDAGDYCDVAHTVEMAKRIKKEGFKLLINFHYSDWWADPRNQTKPRAWENMSVDEMAEALYSFTKEALEALIQADACPDMVQIGNEIGNGILWEEGRAGNWENLAKFLNSGIKAVRDVTPEDKEIKIMLHIQDGGSVEFCENFFTNIEAHGVKDYDIIGLTYYPYWNGTFEDLKNNINNLAEKFNKDIIVAETAFPYTYENADSTANLVGPEQKEVTGIDASVENQKLVTEMVMNTVATSNRGIGIFYWEPVWIPVKGVGAAKGGGNQWENQAMFDFNGKALESLKAFKFKPGSMKNDIPVTVYKHKEVSINLGSTTEEIRNDLPKTLKVLYSDGTIRETPVEWDLSGISADKETRLTVKGKVLSFESELTVNVVRKGVLGNLGFEDGNLLWEIEGSTESGSITNSSDGTPKSGSWYFQYWDNKEFTIDLHQTFVVEETGEYMLGVWSHGIEGSDLKLELYIKDKNNNVLGSQTFTNAGWAVWQHPQIRGIRLNKGDEVTIGVKIMGTPDDWGTIDDFEFGIDDGEQASADEESGNAEAAPGADVANGGNLFKNYSFEEGDTGWNIVKSSDAGIARNDKDSTPKTGTWSFHYWNDKEFTIDIHQSITIPASSKYTLSVWSQGIEDSALKLELYIADKDGKVIESVEFTNSGWSNWQHPEIKDISLTEGDTVTAGVKITGTPGDWGTLDDFEFYLSGE